MKSVDIVIYCDGACSGNPGPGGFGSIVIIGNSVIELGGGDRATTNNRMEMSAVLEALRYCNRTYSKGEIGTIQIFTDSVYVIRGITQWIFGWKKRGWKNAANEDVSNQDIWIQLDQSVSDIKKKLTDDIKWNFVKGHSGVAGNERCDVIAVAYSKNDYIDLYKGSAASYIFDVRELPEIKSVPEMKKKTDSNSPKPAAWYLSYVNGVLSKHATWSECEAVVKGRPAKFKKVSSQDEEAAIKKSWGIY
ncbi:MAG: ribonuclease H [Bdellovibrionota bacterium]